MRPPIVVKSDPVTDDSHRMRLTFEAMPVDALFLERPDDALDQSVLLRAMRRDELLFQPIAADQARIVPTGKNQPIVRAQQKRTGDPPQRPKPGDERLLQCRRGGACPATPRQLPAQQFPCMAVDHERQGQPAIVAAPDPAEVRRPAFIRTRGNRGERLDPRTKANRALADLPAFDLEDPLDRVLVETQEISHRAIAEGGLLLDHRLDRLHKGGVQPRRSLAGLVIDRPSGHVKPLTKL